MFSSEFIPDDYEVRRRDRETDDHGGVLVATKKNLLNNIRDPCKSRGRADERKSRPPKTEKLSCDIIVQAPQQAR